MKKLALFLLLLVVLLIGCSSENKIGISDATAKTAEQEDKVEGSENFNYVNSSVNGKFKLSEGDYFDSKCFGREMQSKYYEIEVSNVRDTSFDFTIYEIQHEELEEKRNVIFMTNTAIFIGDGSEAAFYGDDYTLEFKFLNYHGAYPVITDISVSGIEEIEGITFVNNET